MWLIRSSAVYVLVKVAASVVFLDRKIVAAFNVSCFYRTEKLRKQRKMTKCTSAWLLLAEKVEPPNLC